MIDGIKSQNKSNRRTCSRIKISNLPQIPEVYSPQMNAFHSKANKIAFQHKKSFEFQKNPPKPSKHFVMQIHYFPGDGQSAARMDDTKESRDGFHLLSRKDSSCHRLNNPCFPIHLEKGHFTDFLKDVLNETDFRYIPFTVPAESLDSGQVFSL